jgi:formate dehydrogenase major subunit
MFRDFIETNEILDHQQDYPYILTTNRNLEHYNAGTMTRRTANKDIVSEDVLFINPVDAASLGIRNGDKVKMESPRGYVDIKAQISNEVKPGILSTTFHFPELMLNLITGDIHDEIAKCPEYKVVSVRIAKIL